MFKPGFYDATIEWNPNGYQVMNFCVGGKYYAAMAVLPDGETMPDNEVFYYIDPEDFKVGFKTIDFTIKAIHVNP